MNSTLPGMEKPLIKVAVPNKGSLSEPAAEMLREAGYAQRSDGELALLDEVNGVEFFYLRPRDIAVYVGEGTLDVGITGRDMLLDSRAHAIEVHAARVRPQQVPICGAAGQQRCRWTSYMIFGWRRRTRDWSSPISRILVSVPGSSLWMVPSKPPSGSELPMSSPMWSRPAPPCGQAGPGVVRRSDLALRSDLDPSGGRRATIWP